MFSVTQTVTQSVRLNATVSKRDVTRRSGGNFSAPPRDDSETFKTSVAGQSNWNAYEGSSEKELTPEEKKAKAKAEEDASNARRAAAAAKMQAEREKAGYKGSIF
ncbi:unnamed protein product [Bathycoccus prasinos]|mmetsp:Transcript_7648/g.23960  ORF Transcript_7648/g.23960 Transcript_7648/m.23960 type:complete len:105 (+) Transcript_7648:79-393(+)